MIPQKVKYQTDNKGKTTDVVISIEDYKKIIEELEELEDIRLAAEAKLDKDKPIPYSRVRKKIEAKWKNTNYLHL